MTSDIGVAVYRLRRINQPPNVVGPTLGIVAIQVNEDQTLTIEPVADVQDPANFQGFSAAKSTYRR